MSIWKPERPEEIPEPLPLFHCSWCTRRMPVYLNLDPAENPLRDLGIDTSMDLCRHCYFKLERAINAYRKHREYFDRVKYDGDGKNDEITTFI